MAKEREMAKDILSLPMESNDARAKTVGEYLCNLLLMVWEEKEGFSGKHPFGNSGWEYDLHFALVKGGAIKGEIYTEEDNGDEWQELGDFDEEAADKVIRDAIRKIFNVKRVAKK